MKSRPIKVPMVGRLRRISATFSSPPAMVPMTPTVSTLMSERPWMTLSPKRASGEPGSSGARLGPKRMPAAM